MYLTRFTEPKLTGAVVKEAVKSYTFPFPFSPVGCTNTTHLT